MRKIVISLLLVLGVFGCKNSVDKSKSQIVVSIDPLGWLVENMVDSSQVSVTILVPPSTSAETYEPTLRQIEILSNAKLFFSIAELDFEKELSTRITSISPDIQYIELNEGIEMIEGSCSGSHNGHHHGVDPHIWLSPKLMQKMAHRVADELRVQGVLDESKSDSMLKVIENVNLKISSKLLIDSTKSKAFAIVHPSLGYFAKDFNLNQIALEIDGKEPSAKQIKGMIEELKSNKVSTILYSAQTSDAVAKIIADELDIELVSFNPLPYNWDSEMLKLAEVIVSSSSKQ